MIHEHTLHHRMLISPFHSIISALWIIISVAHSRSGIQPDQTFWQHLQQQIRKHQRLLYAPCILIFLSSPRLIISFVSSCMRSAREPCLYLIGYFISFIPSMLTFVVFVLPLKSYKDEFQTMVRQTIRRFRMI